MERKLASIQKIIKLEPIEGADRIEKATILGWECVVRKGEFKEGDLCLYLEVDSLLPKREWNEFLFKGQENKTEARLRTIKLKNQISQGLALPLYATLEAEGYTQKLHDIIDSKTSKTIIEGYTLGTDLTELLRIEKYEPIIPACLSGKIKGYRPDWVHKTDETRIQAVPNVLERHQGTRVYVTEKVDGSSMSIYYKDGKFGVCSRKLDLTEEDRNSFWQIARQLDLENKLKQWGRNVTIQGELYGSGICGNKYKLKEHRFGLFNVYNIDIGLYYNWEELIIFVKQFSLEKVPYICRMTLHHTIGELVELSKSKSKINPDIPREGIVVRPIYEQYDPTLRRLSFKVINPEFLLRYGE